MRISRIVVNSGTNPALLVGRHSAQRVGLYVNIAAEGVSSSIDSRQAVHGFESFLGRF